MTDEEFDAAVKHLTNRLVHLAKLDEPKPLLDQLEAFFRLADLAKFFVQVVRESLESPATTADGGAEETGQK